jgi:hypothetical protein
MIPWFQDPRFYQYFKPRYALSLITMGYAICVKVHFLIMHVNLITKFKLGTTKLNLNNSPSSTQIKDL